MLARLVRITSLRISAYLNLVDAVPRGLAHDIDLNVDIDNETRKIAATFDLAIRRIRARRADEVQLSRSDPGRRRALAETWGGESKACAKAAVNAVEAAYGAGTELYLDGNSLGRPPSGASKLLSEAFERWSNDLILAWRDARPTCHPHLRRQLPHRPLCPTVACRTARPTPRCAASRSGERTRPWHVGGAPSMTTLRWSAYLTWPIGQGHSWTLPP